MYYLTINGQRHAVTTSPDGTQLYDPPLPESHAAKCKTKLKEMLDSQTPPSANSDTSFHAGRGTFLSQLGDDRAWAEHLAKQAKKRGYTVGASDVYLGQLDDAQGGNPDAFFKPSEGKSDLKKRVLKSGKGVDMPGLYVAPTSTGPKRKALNPKITSRLMNHYKQTGEASGKTDQELKSYVEKKHGRPL